MAEPERRTIRDELDANREQSDEAFSRQLAQSQMERIEQQREGYWDAIKPDIGREDYPDELPEAIATEISNIFSVGNITRNDFESWQWRIENEFDLIPIEYRDPDSQLDDLDQASMYGRVTGEYTDEMARRLRSAQQAKKMQASLSVNAMGLRHGTEMHAVTKSEKLAEEEEGGGILSSMKRRLV